MTVAQADEGAGVVLIVIWVAVAVLVFASLWRVYTKAGQPGWAALVPIYNLIVLFRIVGRPWWWIFLLLIPIVNIVILFIVYIDLAKSFDRSTAFGVGLALLGIVFLPILAWGPATYRGPAAAQAGGGMAAPSAPPQMAPPQMSPPPPMSPPAPPPPPMPPPGGATPPAPPPP
jgi:hypothetical protein